MMTLSVIFYIWCHNSKHFAILFQIFEVCTQAQNKAMKKCPIIISSCLMKSKYAKVVSDLYNSLKSLTWQGYWRAILKSCPSAPCASRTFCEHFFDGSIEILTGRIVKMVKPTLQNGQTHSNNSSATADELFEYVWPYCRVVTQRVK